MVVSGSVLELDVGGHLLVLLGWIVHDRLRGEPQPVCAIEHDRAQGGHYVYLWLVPKVPVPLEMQVEGDEQGEASCR